jgi:hypothetical protein
MRSKKERCTSIFVIPSAECRLYSALYSCFNYNNGGMCTALSEAESNRVLLAPGSGSVSILNEPRLPHFCHHKTQIAIIVRNFKFSIKTLNFLTNIFFLLVLWIGIVLMRSLIGSDFPFYADPDPTPKFYTCWKKSFIHSHSSASLHCFFLSCLNF